MLPEEKPLDLARSIIANAPDYSPPMVALARIALRALEGGIIDAEIQRLNAAQIAATPVLRMHGPHPERAKR